MAQPILIMGEPGSGKTSSLRNLDPETTFYIDADKKGLNWKGWKNQYNAQNKNYVKTDKADGDNSALSWLIKINEKSDSKYKTIVIDTLNGLMVADEMRRMKEKNYDKWQDLAMSVYALVDYGLRVRDDLRIIYLMHSQTEKDDSGFQFTRAKTSGKKLDKISLESKFNIVLLAKIVDGKHVFEVHANNSTVRTPFDAFDTDSVPNDIMEVLKVLDEY